MATFKYKDKEYKVDNDGFLADFKIWDEDFAEGMAAGCGIKGGLTDDHWHIIHYIHDSLTNTGMCPVVYKTCRVNNLNLADLKELFPTGYLRCACKLAGVTYKEGYIGHSWLLTTAEDIEPIPINKTYNVDVRGFLIDPDEWDEHFALFKAFEMKMSTELTEKHWKIIEYLRHSFQDMGTVPTVYETCEAGRITIEELETLFPDGYHRGAVKIAGLKAR